MVVKIIQPKRYLDDRGWFIETYNENTFAKFGIEDRFRQDNHSKSYRAGTLRGLHLQVPPNSQAKLVRCIHGRIWDVAIDVRRGSPSYGKWVAFELSAADGLMLYVPSGLAHGFITLEPDSEVEYKVSSAYSPSSERSILWNDPDLAIAWPVTGTTPLLSPKDSCAKSLSEQRFDFEYDGCPLTLEEMS